MTELDQISILPLEIGFDFSKTKICGECNGFGEWGTVGGFHLCSVCGADENFDLLVDHLRQLQSLRDFISTTKLADPVKGALLLVIGAYETPVRQMEIDGDIPLAFVGNALMRLANEGPGKPDGCENG